MTGTMKAAVLHGQQILSIDDVPIPQPAAGEVLLRVSAAGICGSDAAFFNDPHMIPGFPRENFPAVTLGHEFSGEIVELGQELRSRWMRPGVRVVCGAGVSCGACKQCLRGRTNLCATYHTVGYHRPGGLAQFVSVPETTLVSAEHSTLSADVLAMGQPMSIAVHAVRRSRLGPGDLAVIIGVGGIGAFLTYAAAATGARVVAADIADARLALAIRLGATAVVRSGVDNLAERCAELGGAPDVVFEVSGTAKGWDLGVEVAAPGTTLIPVGLQRGPTAVDLASWTHREFEVVGTVAHVLATDLPRALELLESRDEGWSDVIDHVLPLTRVESDGLRPLIDGRPSQIKTLVDPWIEQARPAQSSRLV
jgi:threonine dehydrogenase-like Zn-dependent dehydrogenase